MAGAVPIQFSVDKLPDVYPETEKNTKGVWPIHVRGPTFKPSVNEPIVISSWFKKFANFPILYASYSIRMQGCHQYRRWYECDNRATILALFGDSNH